MTDIWGHMLMCDALWAWYEYSHDGRIVTLLGDFFRFCNALPDERLLPAPFKGLDWHFTIQNARACDLNPTLYAFYGKTHDPVCLALARRLFARCDRPKTFMDAHNVNFAQRFAYETVFSRRSGNPSHRAFADYWYDLNSKLWGGEFPRGGFAADECMRAGCFDARQATESCCWCELVRSFRELANLTGEPKWCDRTEDVVFNWHPVAFTPDWKRVHYLTGANMVALDATTDHNYMDSAPRIAYSGFRYRCCLHNAALALPLFAENLTRVAPNGDLVIALYAPHAGRLGATSWRMETRYPFRETVSLEFSGLGARGVRLRVPGWAKGFAVKRNGRPFAASAEAGRWLDLRGTWGETERFEIEMKAECSLSTHVRTHAVTVDRGPLSYSLELGERYRDVPAPTFETAADGTSVGVFPAEKEGAAGERMTEVLPVRDWNYALVRTKGLVFRERPWTEDCFVASNAVCEIVATGRKVPEWTLQDGEPAALQESPVATDAPAFAETVASDTFYRHTAVSNVYAVTGTVTGGGTYYVGTHVTLSATPTTPSEFAGWSDGVTENPRTVTVTSNATYTAVFEPPSLKSALGLGGTDVEVSVEGDSESWIAVNGSSSYVQRANGAPDGTLKLTIPANGTLSVEVMCQNMTRFA